MSAIDRAAQIFGNYSALADRLGVSKSMVSQWRNGERPVSLSFSCAIERETAGEVGANEVRPDVTWTRIPDQTWPHPEGRPLVDITRVAA